MNLRVIKPGVLDTVQDMGRYGWQHLGINPGGVMDKASAQLANSLVGNTWKEAVIELHFPASAFFFEKPALIAVTGADFTPSVNGEEIPCLHPVLLSKFSILQFHRVQTGARAYLAIYGGLDVAPWLDSYSTQLKAIAGGHLGRALQKDDEVKLKSELDFSATLGKKEFEVLPWKGDHRWDETDQATILVLPGNEWEGLDKRSQEKFTSESFIITMQSDRMGYHLKGAPLTTQLPGEMISSAVNFGTVQLLPDGQLILLMADHQTAGGYPRVAHVISAHQPRLAQMRPGETIRFQFTDHDTAEKLFVQQQQHLQQLHTASLFKLEELLHARQH
jgi:antagonist of KipI